MRFVKDTTETVYCHYAFELTDENYTSFVEDMVECINEYMSPAPDFVPIKATDFSMDLLKAIWRGDEDNNVPEWVMEEYKIDEYYTHVSIYRYIEQYIADLVFDNCVVREFGELDYEGDFVED